jgi:hypothetical protein
MHYTESSGGPITPHRDQIHEKAEILLWVRNAAWGSLERDLHPITGVTGVGVDWTIIMSL